ncbi:hypothetical protein HHX47_DHR4000882 [Lentinula edodes]|nr:hypothetical protein HHX47_DHR4000882 [Lentinula edodes]
MASRDYSERQERPPYVPTPDSLSYDEGAFKDIEKSLPIEKCTAIPTLQESTPIDDTPDGGLHAWLVLFGVAAGVFSGPVIAILSQWFRKRRGLALGLYAAGASLGGTVLPITAKALIPTIGYVPVLSFSLTGKFSWPSRFPWTIRVIALIIMFGLALGNLPNLVSNWPHLTHAKVTTYVAALAINIGVSTSFSFYLVSICNACSGVSRITSGLTADRTGAMNLMIPFITLSVVVYCVWPFARAEVSLVIISVLYGVSIGPFASLFSSPVLDLGEKDQLGRRIGILMSMVGIAMLVGAPITGAVDKSRGPIAMGLYAGS